MEKEFYERMYEEYSNVLYMNGEYDGVTISYDAYEYNIQKWEKNKKGLIEKLSASPYYNEKEFCIIKPITVNREPDYKDVYQRIEYFLDKMYDISTCDPLLVFIKESLMYIKRTYDSYALDSDCDWNDYKDKLDTVIKTQDINSLRALFAECYWEPIICRNILLRFVKYRPEQHIGKMFDKLLELLDSVKVRICVYRDRLDSWFKAPLGRPKVDRFGGEYYTYNQLHDYIKDIIVDKPLDKYLVISCHPIDYLTQSHLKSGSSCHSIKDNGCYHAATLTTLTDPSTLICYLLDKADIDINGDLSGMHTVLKDSRVLCNYGNGLLIVNQMYPQKVGDERTQIINTLKELLNDNPENWEKIDMDRDDYDEFVDSDEYRGYNDFMNGKKALFLINESEHRPGSCLILGRAARCIDCDDEWCGYDDEGTLLSQRNNYEDEWED